MPLPVNRIKNLFIVILIAIAYQGFAQEEDTVKKFRKYDLLPAISFSPETGLTLGVIGYRYLRLGKTDPDTKTSTIDFVAVYTTKNQVIVESRYDIITDGSKFRFRGFVGYNLYPVSLSTSP